jgi:hypothetical protein
VDGCRQEATDLPALGERNGLDADLRTLLNLRGLDHLFISGDTGNRGCRKSVAFVLRENASITLHARFRQARLLLFSLDEETLHLAGEELRQALYPYVPEGP